MKTHIALNTQKFDESVAFYKAFFGKDPVKLKPGYAKFDIDDPGLNLTLNLPRANSSAKGGLNHLGIQVATSGEVWKAKERLQQAGLASFDEHDTTCCYALQDKIWIVDPNGYNWEVFAVKVPDLPEESAACCADPQTCCT